jgi:hypothetical protein
MSVRRFTSAMMVAAAFAAALPIPVQALSIATGSAGTTTAGGTTLVGTWPATVTPPPESGLPPFKLLFTFHGDGTLVATGTAGELPALGNPCQGVWSTTPAGDYAVTYLCFDFDGNLQYAGYDKIRGKLSVDRAAHLTGALDLTHYDTNGDEVFSACCATAVAVRLRVEPLP